jgi:hypothetical protein
MRWLAMLPGFDPDRLEDLLARKLDDYHARDLFRDGLSRLHDLANIVNESAFTAQLGRFLPASTLARTIDRPEFRTSLVEEVRGLYAKAGW